MDTKKTIFYGVIIWAIIFAVATGIMNYISGMAFEILMWLLSFGAAWYAAKKLVIKNQADGFSVGIVWVIVGLILDLLITRQFSGWGLFYAWTYWVSYIIILATPIISVKK